MTKTFLPFITSAGIVGQDEPQSNALALYSLMCDDPRQQRPVCIYDERIAAVAQARCDQQLRDGAIFVHHVDNFGHGPNWWLRQAGIWLPDWYDKSDGGNNVESIGLNYLTADDCWRAWLSSPTHRAHVLGDPPTFITQVCVGIGHAIGTEPWPNFWILMSVPPVEGS